MWQTTAKILTVLKHKAMFLKPESKTATFLFSCSILELLPRTTSQEKYSHWK